MRDKIKDGILFAYYGGLLNEHQQEIMRLYYDNDMSLSEISEIYGSSRQAIRDTIIRCAVKLEECESKLGLAKKIRSVVISVEKFISRGKYTNEEIVELKKIISDIEEI